MDWIQHVSVLAPLPTIFQWYKCIYRYVSF